MKHAAAGCSAGFLGTGVCSANVLTGILDVTAHSTNMQPVVGTDRRAKQDAASTERAVLLHNPHCSCVFWAGGSCGSDEGPDSLHRQLYDLGGNASSKELQPPLSILVNPSLHRHRRTPGLEVSVTTEGQKDKPGCSWALSKGASFHVCKPR